jgi:hypothetical protein
MQDIENYETKMNDENYRFEGFKNGGGVLNLDYPSRFNQFAKDLSKLSTKYGIAISGVGCVYDSHTRSVYYSNDWSSVDIMPNQTKVRFNADAPPEYYMFIDGLEKISNDWDITVQIVGGVSIVKGIVEYDKDWSSNDLTYTLNGKKYFKNGGNTDNGRPNGINYMGVKGESYVIQSSGKGDFLQYHLIKSTSPNDMVDMFFDSIDEAKKYADKKGLIVVDKFVNEYKQGGSVQYKKEVDAYKYFVVNIATKEIWGGFEYKGDAEESRDFHNDKNWKVLHESTLKKLGIENPKEKWKKMEKGGGVDNVRFGGMGANGKVISRIYDDMTEPEVIQWWKDRDWVQVDEHTPLTKPYEFHILHLDKKQHKLPKTKSKTINPQLN